MQPEQPIDPMQGQMPEQGGSNVPPMMLVQIVKAIQPFIKQMVQMEVQMALQGEQQQEMPQGKQYVG